MQEKITFSQKAIFCLKKHTLKWVLLGCLILLIVIALCWWFHEVDSLVKIATILSACFAGGSVIYLAKQIGMMIRQDRYQRSHEFIKRFNSKEFIEIISNVKKCCEVFEDSNKSDNEKWNYVEADPKRKQDLNMFLNFFEELGLMYNEKLTNKKITKGFFKGISVGYFEKCYLYIKDRRIRQNHSTMFENWEKMVEELKKQ